jgi:hypothetical protein
MSYQQHVRAQCLDCAVPMFVIGDVDGTATRCARCLRKYDQQLYLLREFLLRH